MRQLLKSIFRFSWSMSLFGANSMGNLMVRPARQTGETAAALDSVAQAAERQLDPWVKSFADSGNRIQEEFINRTFGGAPQNSWSPTPVSEAVRATELDTGPGSQSQPAVSQPAVSLPLPVSERPRSGNNNIRGPVSTASIQVPLSSTTQGPFWPPSEVVDENGDFIVVGGIILKEIAPGKVAPVGNRTGVIVSKDTRPPLVNGREDYSNPFGAPYQVIRELDLSPSGPDWNIIPHSLSCGPFAGDFGGGSPRIPAMDHGRYNLNSNPRWNKWIAPVGAESPEYYRPSYPLHEVPICGLEGIPADLSIGVRVDPGDPRTAGAAAADFRDHRRAIALRDLLRGRGDLQISLLREGQGSHPRSARLDFVLQGLLPHSLYSIFAVHTVTLSPPDSPDFVLPVPIGFPNVLVTDSGGSVSASFVLRNPFPAPAEDHEGNRLAGVAVLYLSDFQNWGAVLTSMGTGVTAHTVLSGDLTHLAEVITED